MSDLDYERMTNDIAARMGTSLSSLVGLARQLIGSGRYCERARLAAEHDRAFSRVAGAYKKRDGSWQITTATDPVTGKKRVTSPEDSAAAQALSERSRGDAITRHIERELYLQRMLPGALAYARVNKLRADEAEKIAARQV